MTIETEVAALTSATTSLLNAVNVSKGVLDQKVADAADQAGLATTNGAVQVALAAAQVVLAGNQAVIATSQANAASASQTAAASSASAAETARAAAVVAQNNAVAVVTGGTASVTPSASKIPVAGADATIGAAWLENNQTFQRLIAGVAYATDLAGHAASSPLVLTPGSPSGTSVGNPGNVAFDSSYLYVCTAKNTWKRIALTAF